MKTESRNTSSGNGQKENSSTANYNPPKSTGWLSWPESFPHVKTTRIDIRLSDAAQIYPANQVLTDAQLLDKIVVCIPPRLVPIDAPKDSLPTHSERFCYAELRWDGKMCCTACGRAVPITPEGETEPEQCHCKMEYGWYRPVTAERLLHANIARFELYLYDASHIYQVIQVLSDAQLLHKVAVSTSPAVHCGRFLPKNDTSDHQDNPVVRTCYLERWWDHSMCCSACGQTIPATIAGELDLERFWYEIEHHQW